MGTWAVDNFGNDFSAVKTISELKDLWEEAGAAEWHGVIEDLERRLLD